jgi:hypothetical protein
MASGIDKDNFEFVKWCEEYELEETTVRALKEKGYKSYKSISKLTEESINKNFKGLTPGQLDLLKEGVALLNPPINSTQDTANMEDNIMTLSGRIESLLSNLPPATASSSTTTAAATTTPSAATHTSTPSGEQQEISVNVSLVPHGKVTYYDIVDFVSSLQPAEHEIWEGEGCHLTINTSARKPSINSISPMQWSASNLRILFQLINDGSLPQPETHSYLLYTLKVSELANVYTWRSVVLYDQAYRRAQAQEGFRWGCDRPHLDRMYLRHKNESNSTTHPQKSSQPSHRTPGSSGQICRNYQRNACGYGATCIHRHICSLPSCGGNHPFVTHHQQQGNE